MDLTFYLRILRRWLWLVIVCACLVGGVAFIVNRSVPPTYEASTTILVGSIFTNLDPSAGVINAGQQLAPNYVAFVKSYSVLQATVENLQLGITPESLGQIVSTRIIPSTLLMQITVTYGDPVLVADIANELTTQLVAKSPTNLTQTQQRQIQVLQDEISRVETQIQDLRSQLAALDEEAKNASAVEQQQSIAQRRRDLGTQINTAQASLAQMTTSLTDLQRQNNTNVLTIVERARIPTVPIGRNVPLITLVATLTGAAIGGGLGFLLDYLNDSIRVPSDIPLGTTLLGIVAPFGRKNVLTDKLIAWKQPRSNITEAYRAIRVSLMHAAMITNLEPHHTFVITSPGPAEGKSTTAANLAVIFANTGLQVVLIDADMRRPTQHILFDIPNSVGLSNILVSAYLGVTKAATSKLEEPLSDYEQKAAITLVKNVVQKTEIAGLSVIPAGPAPENPAELLGTVQLQSLIRMLHEDLEYDVIVIDTPPTLSVSDTTILASLIDNHVALVVEAGSTRKAATAHALELLRNLSVPIAGIVLNRANLRDTEASYGYYYGYYDYDSSRENDPRLRTSGHRLMPATPNRNGSKGEAVQDTMSKEE
ncbi:MAG: P-loop NTPase [Anaerolineae bacterium]|nr:P-loop NTPase [Anaerolineae bacterium]